MDGSTSEQVRTNGMLSQKALKCYEMHQWACRVVAESMSRGLNRDE